MELGLPMEYCKTEYFKIAANEKLFVKTTFDRLKGTEVKVLRSTAHLTKEELMIAIDRFRFWCAQHGIYIPEAHQTDMLTQAEIEIQRNRQFL